MNNECLTRQRETRESIRLAASQGDHFTAAEIALECDDIFDYNGLPYFQAQGLTHAILASRERNAGCLMCCRDRDCVTPAELASIQVGLAQFAAGERVSSDWLFDGDEAEEEMPG